MVGFGQLDWDVPSVREWLRKPQNEQRRGDVVEICLKWLISQGLGPLSRTQGLVSINGHSYCFYGYLRKGNDTPFFNQPSKTELPHFYIIQMSDGDAVSPQTFCWGEKRYQVVTVEADILSKLQDNFRIDVSPKTDFSETSLRNNVLNITPLTEEEFLNQFSEGGKNG